MNKFAITLCAASLAAGFVPVAAMAQDSAVTMEIKRGTMIYSADGKRIGNVYRTTASGDVQLIYRSKMITIAASTVSNAGGKLSTSLTLAEVRALA
jgi:hypothetical protein